MHSGRLKSLISTMILSIDNMKTREEIEKFFSDGISPLVVQGLQLEVLLDIRDLLDDQKHLLGEIKRNTF